MALIKLTASELENVHSQISKMSSKASDCANKVSSVRNGLDMEITAKRNIEERLDNIKRDLTKHSESLKLHANVLNDVINEFVRTDSSGSVLQSATSITDWMNGVIAGGAIGGAIASGIGISMRHTGEMYNWQTQQQLEKIRNAANICAGSSLEKEETDFWGSFWNKGKEAINKISDKAKEAYGNVVQAGKDCVSWVKDNYENKGITYTLTQYTKAFGKVAAGGAMIAAAVASGGALAGVTGVYGVDSMVNGLVDIGKITYNISEGKTAEIEKTAVVEDFGKFVVGGAGGAIGEAFGNAELGEEIGEKVASIAYDGGKIASSVYTISTGWDKIQQAKDFNLKGIADEAGDAAKDAWDLATKVEFNKLSDIVKVDLSSPFTSSIFKMGDALKYELTLLGKEIPHTANAFRNLSLINNFAGSVIAEPAEVIKDVLSGKDIEIGGIVGKVKDLVTETFNN